MCFDRARPAPECLFKEDRKKRERERERGRRFEIRVADKYDAGEGEMKCVCVVQGIAGRDALIAMLVGVLCGLQVLAR